MCTLHKIVLCDTGFVHDVVEHKTEFVNSDDTSTHHIHKTLRSEIDGQMRRWNVTGKIVRWTRTWPCTHTGKTINSNSRCCIQLTIINTRCVVYAERRDAYAERRLYTVARWLSACPSVHLSSKSRDFQHWFRFML